MLCYAYFLPSEINTSQARNRSTMTWERENMPYSKCNCSLFKLLSLRILNKCYFAVMFAPRSLSLYQYHPEPLLSCPSLLSNAHQPRVWHFYSEHSRSEYFSAHSSGCERQHSYCLAVCYNEKNAAPHSSNTMVIYLLNANFQYWVDALKKQLSAVIF